MLAGQRKQGPKKKKVLVGTVTQKSRAKDEYFEVEAHAANRDFLV
jgi:hypothetical protein